MVLVYASCAYCGADITLRDPGIGTEKRPWERRKVVHINICQEPAILYFCNQNCKLNWIFKRPDLEPEKDIKDKSGKNEITVIDDEAVNKDNTDELKKYLKDHKVKIIRQA